MFPLSLHSANSRHSPKKFIPVLRCCLIFICEKLCFIIIIFWGNCDVRFGEAYCFHPEVLLKAESELKK